MGAETRSASLYCYVERELFLIVVVVEKCIIILY